MGKREKPKTDPNLEEKYWALPLVLVMLAYFFLQLPQSWLVKTSFSPARTYPFASVMGEAVGGLDARQLNGRIAQLESGYKAQQIILTGAEGQWAFSADELGIGFDERATTQAVWHLNDLSFTDKFRLLIGNISPAVEPALLIDGNKCNDALATITVVEKAPQDAVVYYDQTLKIDPDQPGIEFNEAANCQRLSELVAHNIFITEVFLDAVPANLTQADIETKLDQIQSIVGQPMSLGHDDYELTLSPSQLLALLEITKSGSDVQVNWSAAKLDELVNSIAAEVNTYTAPPALSGCQYVVSAGGSWLDKDATKNFIQSLNDDSPRSFTLPVGDHQPVIGELSPVAAGNNGTIYLTFDDAPTYGNEIMNYAACYGVKVTFFVMGSIAGDHAAVLQRAVNAGHAVQSHGNVHAVYDYGENTYDWQYNDIAQSITNIMSVTGVRPTYFRPPGGNRSADTYTAAADNGLKLILWGVSSTDTTSIGSSAICAKVLAGAYPGASVLMHASKQKTAAAVPCIIEGLASKGYSMAALR